MPCVCDDPNGREQEQTRVAELLMYALPLTGCMPRSVVIEASRSCYGSAVLDELTDELCDICRVWESEGKADEYIYDGRSKDARKLADWWECHQEVDSKRMMKSIKEKLNHSEFSYITNLLGS